MTTTPSREQVRCLDIAAVSAVVACLEGPEWAPGGAGNGAVAHQYLLDALDRGQFERFLVWWSDRPRGVLYIGPTGNLVPAGEVAAGAPLGEAAERLGWRVLVGDAGISRALLEAAPRGVFRRRLNAREQRLMALTAADRDTATFTAPAGLRPGHRRDLDRLVEFAAQLHVEDRMGPPIARSARASVRGRMLDSLEHGATWVVDRGGRAVAKADLSLRSPPRGAQIAGVFVAPGARGQGIGSGLVGALTRLLLAEGLPSVSLHVRADNAAAIAAYRRAGLTDRGQWVLALR